MKDRKYYYSVIPAKVRCCKKLSFDAQIFYSEILERATVQGLCLVERGFFSDFFKVKESVISSWAFELKGEGILITENIEKEKFGKALVAYHILFPWY